MMDWCDRYDTESGTSDTKKMVIGLMMTMSMLDRTKTPKSLFTQPSDRAFKSLPFGSLFVVPDHKHDENNNFDRVQIILERHGFLLPSPGDSECVGAMHQLVQRAVREHLMDPDAHDIVGSWTKGLLDTVEAALKAQSWYNVNDMHSDANMLPRLRALRPAMERWCHHTCNPTTKHLCGYEQGSHDLLYTLGDMLREDGEYTTSARLLSTVLTFRRGVLGEDHDDVLRAMVSLGITYTKMERFDEVLKLEEQVLVLYKKTLPPEDPRIVDAMNNLATTYSRLGRHDEGLKLQEKVLVLYKKILPPEHPYIALAMHNLAIAYLQLNRLDDAVKMSEDALEFKKRILPENHPDIGDSLTVLSSIYMMLGRYQDALMSAREALTIFKQSYPPGHPEIDDAEELVADRQSLV